jgi:hypothetical protein
MPSHTISAANASVHVPEAHHDSILARSGVSFQDGWTTFQLAPSGTPTPHEYTQPHSFATTGRHRRVAAAAAVATALTGAARFDAGGSTE